MLYLFVLVSFPTSCPLEHETAKYIYFTKYTSHGHTGFFCLFFFKGDIGLIPAPTEVSDKTLSDFNENWIRLHIFNQTGIHTKKNAMPFLKVTHSKY